MNASTPGPGRLLAGKDVARAVGIGQVWFELMTRTLKFPPPAGTRKGVQEWDQNVVKRWLLGFEPSSHELTADVEHLRWLVLRLVARRSPTSIRAAVGPWAQVERVTVTAAVHLVRRVPYQVQQEWAAARHAAVSDQQIARTARVGVSLVRLTLDGIPKPLRGGRINPHLLQQLWEQGQPVEVIAQTVGHSVERTQREIAGAGDRLAPRLNVAQVAHGFGWTRTNVRGLRQPGRFPHPDSLPGTVSANGKGAWWWASTLALWEAEVNLQTCPVCGGRFQRLNTHQAVRHQDQAR